MSDTYQAVYDAVRGRISNCDIGQAVQDAIYQEIQGLSCAIEGIQIEYAQAADAHRLAGIAAKQPSAIYRPAIFRDGDKWCALYGVNLQDGVAGFGDTPEAAMAQFDLAWRSRPTPKSSRTTNAG